MSHLKSFVQTYWLLMLFLATKMAIQFMVVNPVYELHRDEFLYLDQANHLSAGYISVPPFMSWLSAIVFFLGGDAFWIRFFPALFGALTLLFAWMMVEELGGKTRAKVLVMSALLFSVYVRLNVLYQPNAFDILCWTAIFYLLVRFIRTGHGKWLMWMGVAFALGFYNKYNIVFLLIGLLLSLPFTPTRKVFVNRGFYWGLLLAALLVLPNLYWQVINRFPVVHHMEALTRTQLDHTTPLGFLTDQVMFVSGSLLVVVAAFVGFLFHEKYRAYRAIVWAYVVVIVLFLVFKAKSYYALGLYPVLLVFGGVYIDAIVRKAWAKYVIGFLVLANIVTFACIYDLILPVKSPAEILAHKERFEKLGLLKWNDGQNHHLPQDFADMQGWKEMAEKSLLAYQLLPDEAKAHTLVFCDNYGQAGALNYYNRHQMPEAYSANTDYIFWMPRFKEIRHVLLVGNRPDDKVVQMFKEIKQVGVVENPFAIEKNTGIYLLTGASDDFTPLFYQQMEDRKLTFDIF